MPKKNTVKGSRKVVENCGFSHVLCRMEWVTPKNGINTYSVWMWGVTHGH